MSSEKFMFEPKASDEACDIPCRHPRCAAVRRTWHFPCARCGGPIYFYATGYVHDQADGPIHHGCMTAEELTAHLPSPADLR